MVCTKIGSGATPRGGQESYKEEGISLIRSQNVLDLDFTLDGLAYIDQQQADDLANVEVQKQDVLINITGDSVARVCMVPDRVLPARVNQHVSILRADPSELNPQYLKYYLINKITKQALLNIANSGATRNALTKGQLESFPILLPPLPEQKAIAAILSSFDDKIELLRRQNKTLESITQLTFDKWFVKDADNKWELTTLAQHISVSRGLSYKGSGLTDDKSSVPMHNLNSVYEGGGYKYEGIKYYNEDYRDRHVIKAGDIIVANTEQGHEYRLIGFPAIVPDIFGHTGIFSQHIYKVDMLDTTYLTSQFIYYLMMTPKVREQIIGATNGTTVNMLAIAGLRYPEFNLPPKDMVLRYSDIVQGHWKKQSENHKQMHTLIRLRDLLLPKLMKGEFCL